MRFGAFYKEENLLLYIVPLVYILSRSLELSSVFSPMRDALSPCIMRQNLSENVPKLSPGQWISTLSSAKHANAAQKNPICIVQYR